MIRIARSLIFALTIFLVGFDASAQTQSASQRSGSISGRITAEGKPLSGVVVTIERFSGTQELLQGKTDTEGLFRIEGIPPGGWYLRPHAYLYTLAESERNIPNSRRLVLGPGESVDGIAIELIRGAVITGRVTDERGRPVVDAHVGLRRPQGEGSEYVSPSLSPSDVGATDDRGVYRIFGVPAGRFLVAATMSTAPQEDTAHYTVYYPNTADESKAKLVELVSGEEIEGVDIQLVPPVKTYKASGRLIDVVSGNPIPGLYIGCQRLDNDRQKAMLEETSPDVRMTDKYGEFTIAGLQPGTHRLTIGTLTIGRDQLVVEWYEEPVDVEIVNQDVGGIELKARRGASVSGVIVVEGPADPQILSLVRPYVQSVMVGEKTVVPGSRSSATAGTDGRFKLSGMRAGEFILSALILPPNMRKLVMHRVEIGGKTLRGPISLEEAQQLSGVRIIMTYGSGVVSGQVRFQNGEPPKGICLEVQITREQETGQDFAVFPYRAQVSAGGQYSLEVLQPGDYELTLLARPCTAEKVPEILPVKQRVRMANGVVIRADFVVDLSAKKQEENR